MWHQGTTMWKVKYCCVMNWLGQARLSFSKAGSKHILGRASNTLGPRPSTFASRLDALRIKQSSFSKTRNIELVMVIVIGHGLCGLVAPDPKNPTLPTMWSYCYQFQSHGSNILEIPCIPLVQQYLINLPLSLFHCIIDSAGFMEFSHFPPFPK